MKHHLIKNKCIFKYGIFVFALLEMCLLIAVGAVSTGCTRGSDQGNACCSGEIELDPTLAAIDVEAFQNCVGLTGSLVIPDSVVIIGMNAFRYCSGLTTLTIGSGVEEIHLRAFTGCTGFTGDLIIPDNVRSLGGWSFLDCSGFDGSLTISDNVPTIGSRAFMGCSGFSGTLIIPDSVSTIGDLAFKNCAGFTGNLAIPVSVTRIYGSAFSDCSNIASITVYEHTVVDNDVFTGSVVPIIVTSDPTGQPTSQPTRDLSFKKFVHDEITDTAVGVFEYFGELKSECRNVLRGFRDSIRPRSYRK